MDTVSIVQWDAGGAKVYIMDKGVMIHEIHINNGTVEAKGKLDEDIEPGYSFVQYTYSDRREG